MARIQHAKIFGLQVLLLQEIAGAGGGGRTLMTSEGRGILSPVRLPVPPLQLGDSNSV